MTTIPILKEPAGLKTTAASFRPISLGNPLRKAFSRIILSRIPLTRMIDPNQYAFVEGRQRDGLLRKVEAAVCQGDDAVSLDVRGAYDTTSMEAISQELHGYFTPESVALIARWTVFEEMYVRTAHGLAYSQKQNAVGIAQGDALSPAIWLFVIQMIIRCANADITESGLAPARFKVYADDVILLTSREERNSRSRIIHTFVKTLRITTGGIRVCSGEE